MTDEKHAAKTEDREVNTPPSETVPTPPAPIPPPAPPPPAAAPKRDPGDLTSAEHEMIESVLRTVLIEQGIEESTIGGDLILAPEEANPAFTTAATRLGLKISGKPGETNVAVGTLLHGLKGWYAAQIDPPAEQSER